ncbi:transposase domain-containing protein [Streptomyces sp. ISL-36]|uniref:transposase domain-containing protein n=1 Tax=Streptomyces sp. ISL-36 TaxID=2819182 RepID=UPI0027E4834F|nr:transposase domain-containing protein [Streptomyces sp. ISL-36]
MLISRLERLGLGVLTRSCPPELVDRVVGDAGRSEKRRRLLSARFTVYFVLAMCLFPQADYLEVLRLVKTGCVSRCVSTPSTASPAGRRRRVFGAGDVLDMPVSLPVRWLSCCRHQAASGGQNREDATTIGRPLSGHTPPARYRQRTIPGQGPTL